MGGLTHDDLDNLLHKFFPVRPLQLISLADQPDLLGPLRRAGQVIDLLQIIVHQLREEPTNTRQFHHGIQRPGVFPIHQAAGHALSCDHIPRRNIPMAPYSLPASNFPEAPWLVALRVLGHKFRSRPMQRPGQTAHLIQRFIRPFLGMNHLARREGIDLLPGFQADHMFHRKAGPFQMAQKIHPVSRPRLLWPVHPILISNHLIGFRERLLSVIHAVSPILPEQFCPHHNAPP